MFLVFGLFCLFSVENLNVRRTIQGFLGSGGACGLYPLSRVGRPGLQVDGQGFSEPEEGCLQQSSGSRLIQRDKRNFRKHKPGPGISVGGGVNMLFEIRISGRRGTARLHRLHRGGQCAQRRPVLPHPNLSGWWACCLLPPPASWCTEHRSQCLLLQTGGP